MEKWLTWYRLLLKANLKKKITWQILIALVLLVLLFWGIRIPDVDNTVVGIGGVADDYAEEVVAVMQEMDSVFTFEIYADTGTLYEDVTSGAVECGFIFSDDFEEQVTEGKLDEAVTYLCTPYAAKGEVAKETVFAAFFQVYSDEILTDVSAEIFAEEDEKRTDEILAAAAEYLDDSSLFHIEEVYVESAVEDEVRESEEESTYPIQGIVGLVIILVTFLAVGSCFEGKNRGLRRFLGRGDRMLFQYLSGLAAAAPVIAAGLILIFALQVQRGILREIATFALMGVAAAAWSMVLAFFLRSETAAVSCVVILVIVHLALYPVFWDAAQYVPAAEYLRCLSPMILLYL
ncbi:MAG: ABC transporter permease [Lachnospiraceae bacterium]|nr:ABC transporter permease [Lachnospiraceae bacterium]